MDELKNRSRLAALLNSTDKTKRVATNYSIAFAVAEHVTDTNMHMITRIVYDINEFAYIVPSEVIEIAKTIFDFLNQPPRIKLLNPTDFDDVIGVKYCFSAFVKECIDANIGLFGDVSFAMSRYLIEYQKETL